MESEARPSEAEEVHSIQGPERARSGEHRSKTAACAALPPSSPEGLPEASAGTHSYVQRPTMCLHRTLADTHDAFFELSESAYQLVPLVQHGKVSPTSFQSVLATTDRTAGATETALHRRLAHVCVCHRHRLLKGRSKTSGLLGLLCCDFRA